MVLMPAKLIWPRAQGKAGQAQALYSSPFCRGRAAAARATPATCAWIRANGVIEVGNILLAPSLQRTIAATEAMYLMARHVFEDLGYRRYEWKCNAEQPPSRRAALRLRVHLRRDLPPAHGDQRPEPRHGLVLDARLRMARPQSRLRSLARSRQFRSGRPPVQITRGNGL